MKRKRKLTPLSEPIIGRPYLITATLSGRTGHLLRLQAGCRIWGDFTEALAHYAGGGKYGITRWLDLRETVTDGSFSCRFSTTDLGRRDQTLMALARLASRVEAVQHRKRKR